MTPIVVAMLKPLLWLLPFLVVGGVLKSPWVKGWLGERKVRSLLRQHLDPSVYREFSNVTVRDEFGDTTQIDHIYVSPYGVFVIETKHMGHWIFGGPHQEAWTQQIYRNKFRFQNPLRQNYRHVKVLSSLLDLPESMFKPVVAFTGGCTFKTAMPDEVRTSSNLVDYVRSMREPILTEGQVASISRELQRSRLAPSWQTHREHVNGLRRRHGTGPSTAPAPSRSRSESFAEVAGERLLRAVEDRIRNDGGRRVSRVAQFGLAAVVAKALLTVVTIGFIWWVLTTAVGNGVQPLQQTTDMAAPVRMPAPQPTSVARATIRSEPAFVAAQPETAQRQPTAEELAERRRRAEETVRILERSTPEIPLALPGSPAVGPSAQPNP